MGCYPLRKMMSIVLGKCKGKERRRASRKMVYSPPPSYASHTRRVVKSVNFSNDNTVILIPPETNAAAPIPKYHQETVVSPSPHASEIAEPNEPDRTRLGPAPTEHEGIPSGSIRREPVSAYTGPVHCYVPSPLPRWEDGVRRREYFSGEYCYYPTPIREGIYSIATDPNGLTAMFSEENPNACSIV